MDSRPTILLLQPEAVTTIDAVSPLPDEQLCKSPAMAVKHCVWHGASPTEQPCGSASPLLKCYIN